MVFKINISDKQGKSWKLELESEELIGRSLGEELSGKELLADLGDYEFIITGTSDKAGFASTNKVEGIGLKKVLLKYGKGLHKKPRGLKKVGKKPKGLRYRKTMRGKVLSANTVQINLKLKKQGTKHLKDIFQDQNKPKEAKKEKSEAEEKSE